MRDTTKISTQPTSNPTADQRRTVGSVLFLGGIIVLGIILVMLLWPERTALRAWFKTS